MLSSLNLVVEFYFTPPLIGHCHITKDLLFRKALLSCSYYRLNTRVILQTPFINRLISYFSFGEQLFCLECCGHLMHCPPLSNWADKDKMTISIISAVAFSKCTPPNAEVASIPVWRCKRSPDNPKLFFFKKIALWSLLL